MIINIILRDYGLKRNKLFCKYIAQRCEISRFEYRLEFGIIMKTGVERAGM